MVDRQIAKMVDQKMNFQIGIIQTTKYLQESVRMLYKVIYIILCYLFEFSFLIRGFGRQPGIFSDQPKYTFSGSLRQHICICIYIQYICCSPRILKQNINISEYILILVYLNTFKIFFYLEYILNICLPRIYLKYMFTQNIS